MRTSGPLLSIPGDAWRRMSASGGDIGKDEVGNSGDNRNSQSRRPFAEAAGRVRHHQGYHRTLHEFGV
jgi:hypothetical protein